MEVRLLHPKDAEIACQIAENYKSKTVTPEYMSRFLSDKRNYLIVGLEGSLVVGFLLGCKMARLETDRPMMYIQDLATHPDYRRQGIGRAMVEEFKAICREKNALKMWLVTDRSNEPAKALYTAAGGALGDNDWVGFWWNEF